MVKSDIGDTNIFNITNAEQYRCQIMHYHNRLSRLYIAVYKGDDRHAPPIFYLLFIDVGYFDCPTSWQGADFMIDTGDACIQLMLDTGLVGAALLRFPNAYASITENAYLYVATTNADRPIRIIASSANMIQKLPANLT
ncbi:MAG: hypothetical protein WBC91_00495 [Phototrophicaceae bacterium]